ncbi:Cht9p [Tyrophagus putrescentiae]|nr:Cht9p [Tyrophagus putrescentiae]
MKLQFQLLALFIVATFAAFGSELVLAKERNTLPYKVVCYYQPGFPAEELDVHTCTHINYAFAILQNGTVHLGNPPHDVGPHGMIARTIALRKKNPHLTIMISVGGWGEGSTKYSEMVRTETNRKAFIQSAVDFIKQHDFDGLDLDWEYPGFSGDGGDDRTIGRAQDKEDYITLLTEMRAAFKPHQYLVTAAIAAGKAEFSRAYNLSAVSSVLDFLNVMSYDYHGAWDHTTAHNSPVYPDPKRSARDQELTMQYTVDAFLRAGVDPKKLILGMPLYGHIYHLADVTKHGVWAPVNGTGREQRANTRLCEEFKKEHGWNFYWDDIAQVPYAANNQSAVWVSYDNLKSIQKKLDFLLEKKLGGSMVWSVDLDSPKNECGEGKFATMKLMMKALNKVNPATV